MSNSFFVFIIVLDCLYSQKCQIGALEAPAKRVSSGYNSVKDRSFYVLIETCFKKLTDINKTICGRCGGTIISSNEILTAGHCVAREKLSTSSAEVFFGDFRRRNVQGVMSDTIKVGPEQIEFLDNTPIFFRSWFRLQHDRVYPELAIVYLGNVEIPMMNGNKLSILRPCPPDSNFWVSKFGARVSVVGLGSTNPNNENSPPKALQEAEFEISEKRCKVGWDVYEDQEILCVVGIKCLHVFGKQLKLHYDTNVNQFYSGSPIFRTIEDGRGECLVGAVQGTLRLKKNQPKKFYKRLRPFQDDGVLISYVTSVQKLSEWKNNGYFVSVKRWNDDQNCLENGTYTSGFRHYIKFSVKH